MNAISHDGVDREQVRRIATEYLQELLHYFEPAQEASSNVTPAQSSDAARLEQRVGDLLRAMAQYTDPQQRREAVLRALCHGEHQ